MSKLIIVPTPIGNLGDISPRAVESLRNCDIVLCEDTRVCMKLLNHFGISKKLISYRDDNEIQQTSKIIDLINEGNVICLTTDAGTPGISDPGFRVVRACRAAGIAIEPLPGPCALTTILSASGLPTDGFLFLGFLPNKSSARIKTFQKFFDFDYTLVCYESCHRITKFMDDFLEIMGPERIICVAKEVTKIHEKFFVGPAIEVKNSLLQFGNKGEYTVIIAPQRFNLQKFS